jgi:uroporphyrinogen-III decarboxylase
MDLNALCSGHISGSANHPGIAAFPDNFTTEAAAFGAKTVTTKNGFPVANYIFYDPSLLTALPSLDETEPVKSVLQALEHKPSGKTGLLKVNGPYSILASLVEPSLFYRWLRSNKNEIDRGLELITRGLAAYLKKAFEKGAKIISLADPYANTTVIGKKHYLAFAGKYLVGLLRSAVESDCRSGIIHICPHNSVALETLGLVSAKAIPVEPPGAAYITVIDNYIRSKTPQGILITGHQCIYCDETKKIIRLEFR